jgi:enoyl-CoA hydratase/carnithine racemase
MLAASLPPEQNQDSVPGAAAVLLEEEHGDGVVGLLWNRPRKRNALSTELYDAATEAILRHSQSDTTRVIVIAGRGPAFCAGMDIQDALQAPMHMKAARRFMTSLASCPKIVMAAIHGSCVGVGTTMLLHCDYVFASNETTLATPFRALGIPPEFGSSFTFPHYLGLGLTARMLYAGEAVRAAEWYAAGAVTRLVEDNGQGVVALAVDYARNMASGVPADEWSAVLRAKKIIRAATKARVHRAMRDEFAEIDRVFRSGVARKLMTERLSELSRKRMTAKM